MGGGELDVALLQGVTMAVPSSSNITVAFHLGAEHVTIDSAPRTTISADKELALRELQIPADPNIDYYLVFKGTTVEDESKPISTLLANEHERHIEFQIKKRPKGGRSQ